MKKFLISLLLIGCSGGGDVKEDKKTPAVTQFASVQISPQSVVIDDATFTLSNGDTLERGPIDEAIAQLSGKDIKIKTDADVAFGLVAYVVDAATSRFRTRRPGGRHTRRRESDQDARGRVW